MECPQLDDFLSMLTRSAAVLSSINIDDASLTGDAGKAVMGYALYQVLCVCVCVCVCVRLCLLARTCVCVCVCVHV